MKDTRKTMKIQPATHQRLCDIGNKGLTFDQIINDLIDFKEQGVKE